MVNEPEPSVVTMRSKPVDGFVIVTLAPAMTAPWASSTVPLRVASVDWLKAVKVKSKKAAQGKSKKAKGKNSGRWSVVGGRCFLIDIIFSPLRNSNHRWTRMDTDRATP